MLLCLWMVGIPITDINNAEGHYVVQEYHNDLFTELWMSVTKFVIKDSVLVNKNYHWVPEKSGDLFLEP